MIYLGRLRIGCQDNFLLLAAEFPSREAALAAYERQLLSFFQMAAAVFAIPLTPKMTPEEVGRSREAILEALACPACGERGLEIQIEETRFKTIAALKKAYPDAVVPREADKPGRPARPRTARAFRRPPLEKIASN